MKQSPIFALRRTALKIAVMVVAVTMIVLFQYASQQAQQADWYERGYFADELKIQQLQAQLDQARATPQPDKRKASR